MVKPSDLDRWGLRARFLALLAFAVLATAGLAALLLTAQHQPRPKEPPPDAARNIAPRPPLDGAPGEGMEGYRPGGPPGDRGRPPPPPSVSLQRLVWVVLIGLMAVLPLGWLLASAWTVRLERLTDAARRLGTARFSAVALPADGPPELRAAAKAFNDMQDRLERQLHDRTQMVAAIAHDLRTPLTRLAFRLEELDGPLRSRVENDMREINMMISAAMEFIRDQSRQRGYEVLDMRLLVEGVADDLSDMGHDVQVESGEPITLAADALALKRVVGNLLDNALKYGGLARVRLAVEGAFCVLQVDDAGPGIPEALLTRVFEPFFRVEGSRSRETGGMGLGLAMVRSIVTEHGGEVWLANRKRGGLRVMVKLPLGEVNRSTAGRH